MPDLLLELFSEEIPAALQPWGAAELEKKLVKRLNDASLVHTGRETFAAPRRIALMVRGLPDKQPDISLEKKGPKTGAPQSAIDGFLKSTGLGVDQLAIRDGVYFASIHQKGKATADALKTILEEELAAFTWPKSMRWGTNDIRWVRPLHNILCLLDGSVLPVTFGHLTANDQTFGHRFLAPQAIAIATPDAYVGKLNAAFVEPRWDVRKASIQTSADETAQRENLAAKPDPGLLEEVTGLVEWPTPTLGGFDESFMDVPPEALQTVMRSHQKYFTLLKNDGGMAPGFLTFSNMMAADGGAKIRAGNERVINARLSDGRFFWDQDRKWGLDAMNAKLSDVVFHAKLGTMADKVKRVTVLAETLAASIPGCDKAQAKRAGELCKADLMSGMVGEFAELQGIMGRYYALEQNEPVAVADAIRDHYRPQGAHDAVPTAPVSIAVALADKLDTLAVMFAIGEKPTGSRDPFALRRAALGIIRVILENGLRLPIGIALAASIPSPWKGEDRGGSVPSCAQRGDITPPNSTPPKSQAAFGSPSGGELKKELLDFFADRLKVQLRDEGIAHDRVAAVFAHGDDDIVRVVNRATALHAFLQTEDGANLLIAYRRAANILAAEEKRDKTAYSGTPDAALFHVPEEVALNRALAQDLPAIYDSIAAEHFERAMTQLAALRPALDAFFDRVTVNDKDAGIRNNRLLLLSLVRTTLDEVANFSKIEG